jgi:hypothetical protein
MPRKVLAKEVGKARQENNGNPKFAPKKINCTEGWTVGFLSVRTKETTDSDNLCFFLLFLTFKNSIS